MKLSETANEVIALAEAIRDYWDAELPKRHPDYPLVHPGEDDGPPPPEEKQLKNLLEHLPADVIYKLALIANLGWGDCKTADLGKQYQKVKEKYGPPDEAAAYLASQPSLEDDLTDGLAQLKKNGIDVDQLVLTPVP
jgi:hypothetical protein